MISVESVGRGLEVIVMDGHAGFSVECSPGELAEFIRQVEDTEPMQNYRRQRSLEAAKEAHSHGARASRR